MENPEPVREHRALEKLAGSYSGPERMHPSYFNAEERRARAVTEARVALDGFAVVQDYVQELEDGTRFAGHGVFRYDMPSDTYELHWFDSTGGPERIFRGGFADNTLVMTARIGDGWQRLSYDFNLDGGYRFRLETSEDGDRWNVAVEGDNFASQSGSARRRQAVTREGARATGNKRATRKAAGKKTAAKKTAGKKASSKKTAGKKTATRAAPKKKAAAGRKATKKAAKKTAAGRKKTTAKKATGRKTASTRTVTKKKASAGKQRSGSKASTKKAAAKKAPAKKAAGRKTAGKKTAKKAGAKVRVSALEKDRRQGKASKKIGPKKKATAGSATRRAVSQKKTESSAQEGPRMPNLKKTSTRVGWHKTAAKGKREN